MSRAIAAAAAIVLKRLPPLASVDPPATPLSSTLHSLLMPKPLEAFRRFRCIMTVSDGLRTIEDYSRQRVPAAGC